ncbi:MAG: GPW/gp25 family protein, partial [Chloroflexota bacterium]
RPRYRAWRFIHPDLDAGAAYSGLSLTLGGRISMVQGDESVRQAILLLLSTLPGERVMRPDYGCHIHRLIFSPNDDTTAGLAIHYVRRALNRWEPRIDVIKLDAGRNPDRPELLDIYLEYRVRATQRVEQLGFSLNLVGEER